MVAVVIAAPGRQGLALLPVRCLIIIADQSNNGCVFSKFVEGVGSMGGNAVVGVQCVQDWTEDTVLGNTSVEDDGRGVWRCPS